MVGKVPKGLLIQDLAKVLFDLAFFSFADPQSFQKVNASERRIPTGGIANTKNPIKIIKASMPLSGGLLFLDMSVLLSLFVT